jgi:hypothetical protein
MYLTDNPYTGPPVTISGLGGQPNATAMQAGNANTAQANALVGLAGGTLKTRRQNRRSAKKTSRVAKKRTNKSNRKNKRNRNNKKTAKGSRKRNKMVGGIGEPIPYKIPIVPYNGGSEIGDISKTLALAHASSSSQSVGDHKV